MSAADARAGASLGGVVARIRVAVSAFVAAVLGVLPHVLHHVGPLAGAALLTGVGSSLIFGLAGLVLSVPFLRKVRRRTRGWRAPVVLLATFAVIFSISSFVIGPAISGEETPAGPMRGGTEEPLRHEQHH